MKGSGWGWCSTISVRENFCKEKEISVAELEPVEPKLFWDLEQEPKINFNKHVLQSVWRMLCTVV